ncbi:MAG: DUF262 domain-containing protein, partial [Bacteroidetes bacterium]
THIMLDDFLELDDTKISFQEDEELKDEVTEVPREVRKLRTQPYDKSIIDLIGMIDRDEIVLRPNFQRNAVWDTKRASQLIESIWLSIPIPQIFVSVEEDGRWNVIDGQQRLTSLKRYYEGAFSLRGMEVLPELNGFKYFELEDKPKRLLNGGNIRIVAIHEDSHPDIKFDVFMRINQGAVQLNAQELRHCLYRGDFNDLLHDLAKNESMLEILNLKNPHNRFKDVEMILRYFAVSESYKRNFEDYPGVMKKFLNDFMSGKRNIDAGYSEVLTARFNENIEKIRIIFGKDAFRKWDSQDGKFESTLNLSLMDCLMLAVEDYAHGAIVINKDKLLDSFKEVFAPYFKEVELFEADEKFIQSITTGTSAKVQLAYRVDYMKSFFSKVIRGTE